MFSGRSGRAEFWLLASVGLALVALGAVVPPPALDGDLGLWTGVAVIALIWIGPTLGQMLLPSHPGLNAYDADARKDIT